MRLLFSKKKLKEADLLVEMEAAATLAAVLDRAKEARVQSAQTAPPEVALEGPPVSTLPPVEQASPATIETSVPLEEEVPEPKQRRGFWSRPPKEPKEKKVKQPKQPKATQAIVALYDWDAHRAGHYRVPDVEMQKLVPSEARFMPERGRPRLSYGIFGSVIGFFWMAMLLFFAGMPQNFIAIMGCFGAALGFCLGALIAPMPLALYIVGRMKYQPLVDKDGKAPPPPKGYEGLKEGDVILTGVGPNMAYRSDLVKELVWDPDKKKMVEQTRQVTIIPASYWYRAEKMEDERHSLITLQAGTEKIEIGLLVLLCGILSIVLFLLLGLYSSSGGPPPPPPPAATAVTVAVSTPVILEGSVPVP